MSQGSIYYCYSYFPISTSYQCQILLADDKKLSRFVCSKLSTSAQRGDNFQLIHNENSTFSGFIRLEKTQWVGFRWKFKSLGIGTQLTKSYNITFVLITDRDGFHDEENGADDEWFKFYVNN